MTVESLIELRERGRKARKKPSKKDSGVSTLPAKPEPSEKKTDAEDVGGDSVASTATQFRDIVQESLKNGDVAKNADSAFVTPRSSSSDFPDFLFLDDVPLAPQKEEEFMVVKRKKKIKTGNLSDKSSSADRRLSQLEACKEILAGRVGGQRQEMFFLPKLESCGSFSISVSTFESRSSSVRSASPANSNLSDCIIKDVSIPKTLDAPLQFLTHTTFPGSENDALSIPGINLCDVLELETKTHNNGVDFDTSEQYVETRTDVYLENSEQHFALSNETSVFLLNPVFPDIVTSTISELPDSMKTDLCQRNLTRKPSNQLLPQLGDVTTVLGEGLLSFMPEDGTFQELSAEKPNPMSEKKVFGDVPFSVFFSQDFRNCDTTFPTKKPAQECSASSCPEPHLKAQAARDFGTCCGRKPVVFLDSLGDVVYNLGISFVFEDDDVSDVGLCRELDRENIPAKVSRLPDLVNPSAILFGSCDADAHDLGHVTGRGHVTDDIMFEFCSAPLLTNDATCRADGQAAPAPALTDVDSLIGGGISDFGPESPSVAMETSPGKSSILSKPNTWSKRSGRKHYHNRCAYSRSVDEGCHANHVTTPLCHTEQGTSDATDNLWQCERGFDLHEAQQFLEESYEEILRDLGACQVTVFHCD